MKKTISILWIALFCSILNVQAQQSPVSVVAAANLKSAMDSVLAVYKQQNPSETIQITYGASGKFYEQIINGAPFDVFFSADMDFPKKTVEKNFAASPVKLYAIGRLAIWSKTIDPNKQQINSLLNSNIHKIAIANPVTAPYGARAVESMKFYNVYDTLKSKLVFGDNIAQAAQFVALGAADIGIIALSEALSPNMKKENGKYYIIPENSHTPLLQGCVILKHGQKNPSATKFYNFISSKKAIGILNYFGYAQKNKNEHT